MVKCLFWSNTFRHSLYCRAYNGFPVFVENRFAKPRKKHLPQSQGVSQGVSKNKLTTTDLIIHLGWKYDDRFLKSFWSVLC